MNAHSRCRGGYTRPLIATLSSATFGRRMPRCALADELRCPHRAVDRGPSPCRSPARVPPRPLCRPPDATAHATSCREVLRTALRLPPAIRRSMFSRRLSSTSSWRCSMSMGEVIASSSSVPLSGRLSRLASSLACLSGPPATIRPPPCGRRSPGRRHHVTGAPSTGHRTRPSAQLFGSATGGFHDLERPLVAAVGAAARSRACAARWAG